MPVKSSFRLLCVDDDRDAAEMVRLLLKSHGIEVSCAQSAAEAWSKIRAKRFDLLMLDVWLPRLGGFEFCRQLRDAGCTTPILFYSGAAGASDRQKAFAVGANAYVTKPDIYGLIEAVLDLIKTTAGVRPAHWFGNQTDPGKTSLST